MAISTGRRRPRGEPLRPVELASFGGLRLDVDPQELGWDGAVDLLNVDFDRDGIVRTREGTLRVVSTELTGPVLLTYTDGETLVLSQTLSGTLTATLYSVDTGSVPSASSVDAWDTGIAFPLFDAVAFGTPTSDLVFIATLDSIGGTTPVTLRKYNGSTLTTSTGSPRYIAVQPNDNRLVQAGFVTADSSPTGANGSLSTVFFSNPGAPETYGANDFVHLRPGDGESITAMAAWSSLLFVFKETRMFVFYGNNTDSAGDTQFNYREVALDGAIKPNRVNRAATGTDGVYFATTTGVYRTTGSTPEKVSGPIEGAWTRPRDEPPYFTPGRVSSEASVTFAHGRLYVAANFLVAPSTTTARTLVFDPYLNVWTLWDDTWLVIEGAPGTHDLFAIYDDHLVRFRRGVETDGGTGAGSGDAIVSYYRTGFADLGTPGSDKVLVRTAVDGTGSPTLKVAVDDGSLDTGAAVTLGTAPAIGRGWRNHAYRGRNFSLQLGASSGSWSASRLTGYVRSERPPGTD